MSEMPKEINVYKHENGDLEPMVGYGKVGDTTYIRHDHPVLVEALKALKLSEQIEKLKQIVEGK